MATFSKVKGLKYVYNICVLEILLGLNTTHGPFLFALHDELRISYCYLGLRF